VGRGILVPPQNSAPLLGLWPSQLKASNLLLNKGPSEPCYCTEGEQIWWGQLRGGGGGGWQRMTIMDDFGRRQWTIQTTILVTMIITWFYAGRLGGSATIKGHATTIIVKSLLLWPDLTVKQKPKAAYPIHDDLLLAWYCHLFVCLSIHLSVMKCVVAKCYILQQKGLNKWIGSAPFKSPIPTFSPQTLYL